MMTGVFMRVSEFLFFHVLVLPTLNNVANTDIFAVQNCAK